MYLSKLTLNSGHPQVRRDLGSAYEMHRTLTRAFVCNEDAHPSSFLWRLERTADSFQDVSVLVQSANAGDWSAIDGISGYTTEVRGNKHVDLSTLINRGRDYRFRLLANPTVCRQGKRYGLTRQEEQLAWLTRQGEKCGFVLRHCVRLVGERLQVWQSRRTNRIVVDTAMFEGVLQVTADEALRTALLRGFGHAKCLGLGMLSLAPIDLSQA